MTGASTSTLPCRSRPSTDARSNRNASMPPSVTQLRRQSSRKLRTTGWSLLNVLPHPL